MNSVTDKTSNRSPFLWTLAFRLRVQAARRTSLTPHRCESFVVQPAKPTWREQRQHQFAD
ncbi:MAG TPA: hypothetical protein VEH27_16330 [Methylomirabilota bacterium]|nr:hypothetical protein [Methylomirabilota bacterium]